MNPPDGRQRAQALLIQAGLKQDFLGRFTRPPQRPYREAATGGLEVAVLDATRVGAPGMVFVQVPMSQIGPSRPIPLRRVVLTHFHAAKPVAGRGVEEIRDLTDEAAVAGPAHPAAAHAAMVAMVHDRPLDGPPAESADQLSLVVPHRTTHSTRAAVLLRTIPFGKKGSREAA